MRLDKVARQNDQAREHVKRTTERLADGRATLERLRESIEDTRRHLESITKWIGESERTLRQQRPETRRQL